VRAAPFIFARSEASLAMPWGGWARLARPAV
jgi:hypothetical protein